MVGFATALDRAKLHTKAVPAPQKMGSSLQTAQKSVLKIKAGALQNVVAVAATQRSKVFVQINKFSKTRKDEASSHTVLAVQLTRSLIATTVVEIMGKENAKDYLRRGVLHTKVASVEAVEVLTFHLPSFPFLSLHQVFPLYRQVQAIRRNLVLTPWANALNARARTDGANLVIVSGVLARKNARPVKTSQIALTRLAKESIKINVRLVPEKTAIARRMINAPTKTKNWAAKSVVEQMIKANVKG